MQKNRLDLLFNCFCCGNSLCLSVLLPVVAVPGHVLLHVALHHAVHPVALAHVAHELDGGGGGRGGGGEEEDEGHRGGKEEEGRAAAHGEVWKMREQFGLVRLAEYIICTRKPKNED